MRGCIGRRQFRRPLEFRNCVREALQAIEHRPHFKVHRRVAGIHRHRFLKQAQRCLRFQRLRVQSFGVEQIRRGAARMRGFVFSEPLGHLRQPARNLIQNPAEEGVRLLGFRGNFDGAQKRIRGIVESAQPVIGHPQRQRELSVVGQPRDAFLENDDGLGELLLVEQRPGGIEIKPGGALASIAVFRNLGGILRRRLRGLQGLIGFRIVNCKPLENRGVLRRQCGRFARGVFGSGVIVQSPVSLGERDPDAAIARRQLARRFEIGLRRGEVAALQGEQAGSKRIVERGRSREQQ